MILAQGRRTYFQDGPLTWLLSRWPAHVVLPRWPTHMAPSKVARPCGPSNVARSRGSFQGGLLTWL